MVQYADFLAHPRARLCNIMQYKTRNVMSGTNAPRIYQRMISLKPSAQKV